MSLFCGLFSLGALVFQNSCLVLLMRYSVTKETSLDDHRFLASVAVMSDELMKLTAMFLLMVLAYCRQPQMSLGASLRHLRAGPPASFCYFIRKHIFGDPMTYLKVGVPALLYTVQKNVLYIAIANLDAAVFQVMYQVKILTTALFAVIILKKRISRTQVLALVVQMMGTGVVQLSLIGKDARKSNEDDNYILGACAVCFAACTSGFAGIYFEKMLKRKDMPQTHFQSLCTDSQDGVLTAIGQVNPVQQFQLASFAFLIGVGGVFYKDREAVYTDGLYQGFSGIIWTMVAFSAFGGILVGLVTRHADSIYKNFALAGSIICSTVVSTIFLDFHISSEFALGATLVLFSLYIYNQYGPGKEPDCMSGTKFPKIALVCLVIFVLVGMVVFQRYTLLSLLIG